MAALASCHMLFVLDFARRAGFVVEAYDDQAEGIMETGPDGRTWMTRVTLKPHIVFAGDKRPRRADVDALHHKAHEACYIANSVKSEVRVEGSRGRPGGGLSTPSPRTAGRRWRRVGRRMRGSTKHPGSRAAQPLTPFPRASPRKRGEGNSPVKRTAAQ